MVTSACCPILYIFPVIFNGMNVGVEAKVMDGDPTLVGNMRGDPGDELQV
jgi:hypothetical protein